jgi:FdhD protein
VRRYGEGVTGDGEDQVAIEAPLEIRLRVAGHAARSISITLRTPGQDEELALGFLLGEGLIRGPADVLDVHTGDADGEQGSVVEVALAEGLAPDLDRLTRHFYATSSCGVCGRASLDALKALGHPPIDAGSFRIDSAWLPVLPETLAGRQSGFTATGGLHATASFDANGHIDRVREDIGRHNATDKVIGAALAAGDLPLAGRGLLFSGRVSFEILQKALMAGCPLVAAVGAPTSLAVELAWETGITLVGFLRDGRFNVYANPSRITA